ncbi:MAG: hypothetical protein ACD_13C00143G0004 [uncultured bacterium]|nr:MAG: hypothetical protein ACD_13C00143G0004 [uncultured bacterium]
MKTNKRLQKFKKTEEQKRKELLMLIEKCNQINLMKKKPITWQEASKYARTFK